MHSEVQSDKARSLKLVILQDVPIINFVFDLIFDAIPTEEGLKDVMNLIGLIDALVLGFVLGMFTSVDFGELTDADNRFMYGGDSGEYKGYKELYKSNFPVSMESGMPSAYIAAQLMQSIVPLFVSLVSILVIYMDFSNKNFIGKSKFQSDKLFEAWWKYAKWAFILCLLTCLAGLFFASSCILGMIMIKFPDRWVDEHGESNGSSSRYPYGWYISISVPIILIIAVVAIVLGLGTRERYAVERELTRIDKLIMEDEEALQNHKKWEDLLFLAKGHIEESEIKELLEEISSSRILFDQRGDLEKDDLQLLGVYRLGDRLLYLSIIKNSEIQKL